MVTFPDFEGMLVLMMRTSDIKTKPDYRQDDSALIRENAWIILLS